MMNIRRLLTCLASVVLVAAFSTAAFAQGRANLRGLITDEFGAAIVGATVTLTDASGAQKTATTNADGTYTFTALAPGKYKLHAIATGFAASEDAPVDVAPARRDPFNIGLKIAAIESQVKINAETPLSTDSSNNANQTVISGKDLDALPDDPDELAAALQALAGPSIGPNGGQIFIDGFSGGNMPPKESIREIRINQNPFAAENDQPSGGINIFTRPGTDKFRGNLNLNFQDESLNSRNPFAISSSKRTPYQVRQFGGNFSGPLKAHKASFFLEANRNELDDNEIIRATILDPSLNFVQLGQGFLVPRRFLNFSPRVDYAINPSNTLVARYSFNHNVTRNNGVGGFSLTERGYNNSSTNQVFQLTETAVLNATTINETRFQFSHNRSESLGDSTKPVLNISGSFVGGGSQLGHAINTSNRWELQNFTQIQHGNHTIKFGGRVRDVRINDVNPNNFGGQWMFTGGTTGLSSLQRYQLTLQLMRQGLTPAQIRAQGGGAAQFSINTGSPLANVSQFDIEPYVQDDWRYRPNLTFSFGLRYEIQNNAGSKLDFAPRFAFAWSPGAANATKPPKTVIRAGAGIFYYRFSESQTLNANRFNGVTEQTFSITEPFRATPPTLAEQADPSVAAVYNLLNSFRCADGSATPDCATTVPSVINVPATQQTIYRILPQIRIPTVYVVGGQVERQLPHNFTVTVGTYAVRILHMIRARDINAPIPGSITTANPSGIRPTAGQGEIYQIEATGKFHQEQMFIGFNSRLNPQFSIQGSYVLSKSTGDADGLFPRDSYDLTGEFGRTTGDVRHQFSVIGTYNSKLWKLVFNPFIVASSGRPFNISTGIDSNLDRQFTDRPSFAGAGANCASPFIKCTSFGNFNLLPAAGEQIIPRNFGQGPGSFTLSLRVSRTFGFGDVHKAAAAPGQSGQTTATAGGDRRGPGGPGSRGPTIPGGGGGEGHGPGGGGGGMGMGGFGGGGSSEKKYTLNVGLFFQNLLNNVNLAPPVGNLSSPFFGQSQSVAGSFGGFGGGGGGGSPNAGNRKISLSVRFNF
jgi:Carboxypeptidase regulatory-like domain